MLTTRQKTKPLPNAERDSMISVAARVPVAVARKASEVADREDVGLSEIIRLTLRRIAMTGSTKFLYEHTA